MKITKGRNIQIYSLRNRYFHNIINFILEHYDQEYYADTVFLLSAVLRDHPFEKFKTAGKRVIVYNWEQLMDGNQHLNVKELIEQISKAEEVWDYDELNIEYLSYFDIKAEFHPFKYTKSLKVIKPVENPEIDLLFYGYLTNFRLEQLKAVCPSLYHDYSFVTLSGCEHEFQNQLIANSKIILNLHSMYPFHRQEQEKIGFCLINKKCVLSDASQKNYFGKAIVERNLRDIGTTVQWLLEEDRYKEIGERGERIFKKLWRGQ